MRQQLEVSDEQYEMSRRIASGRTDKYLQRVRQGLSDNHPYGPLDTYRMNLMGILGEVVMAHLTGGFFDFDVWIEHGDDGTDILLPNDKRLQVKTAVWRDQELRLCVPTYLYKPGLVDWYCLLLTSGDPDQPFLWSAGVITGAKFDQTQATIKPIQLRPGGNFAHYVMEKQLHPLWEMVPTPDDLEIALI